MEELKSLWDKSSPEERLEIVNNQINTWLPIQYQDYKFIEYMFDELPEAVMLWLVKYYKTKTKMKNNIYFMPDKKLGTKPHSCIFEQLVIKSKKVFYVPVKDKNGLPKDKFMKVTEGSELYKNLLGDNNKLPNCWIIEE